MSNAVRVDEDLLGASVFGIGSLPEVKRKLNEVGSSVNSPAYTKMSGQQLDACIARLKDQDIERYQRIQAQVRATNVSQDRLNSMSGFRFDSASEKAYSW